VAELTNAQVALQAAVATYAEVSGTYLSTSTIINRADEFKKWLDKKDRE
jgi:hypothetical protein